jgi:uncharacterized protein YdeI (YjbR/CyaY-like superfamily)
VTDNNKPRAELPIELFEDQAAWAAWLETHHADSPGLWLRHAKKASGLASVSYAEALDVALCYGWIDGQKKSYDQASWIQKWTPRGPKSIWSKINCGHVERLIESGQMRPAGLAAVERAKKDGRWDAAYDSHSNATVPSDLQAALDGNAEAAAFFANLNSTNRYAILFRVQTAKKPETRAKRIEEFVAMLARHEKMHP